MATYDIYYYKNFNKVDSRALLGIIKIIACLKINLQHIITFY